VGTLFSPGDARGLAAALVAMARRDRDELRRATLRHFEEHLSFDVVGRRLRDAYLALRDGGA
jgi:glycosyltransferase involved in cell wall biosynthesis